MKNWRQELLIVLKDKNGQYISGEELAVRFGFSRAALWKKISILRSEGYPIEATTNRGYRLMPVDRAFERQIKDALVDVNLDRYFDIHVTDSTPSTTLIARDAGSSEKEKRVREEEAALDERLDERLGERKEIGVYIALSQTAGRGRRGKTWISDTKEGLWFSFLLKPEMEPERAPVLTLFFGLCIMKALQDACNIQVGIKWPNDIVSLKNGKKLCGILSETSMEDNQISYVVVGCGINVSQSSFPEEIMDVATSLLLEGAITSGLDVLMAVFKEVHTRYEDFLINPLGFLPEYRANCVTLGREVKIESGPVREGPTAATAAVTARCAATGTATGISDSGDLLVRLDDGTTHICRSGEVSVRGILGYL